MSGALTSTFHALSAYGWLALGVTGQLIFYARFVLQWRYSERRGYSAIPLAFWCASLVGSAILLAYAIHLRDPVFIAGNAGGSLIYLRNLQLRLREARNGSGDDTC